MSWGDFHEDILWLVSGHLWKRYVSILCSYIIPFCSFKDITIPTKSYIFNGKLPAA